MCIAYTHTLGSLKYVQFAHGDRFRSLLGDPPLTSWLSWAQRPWDPRRETSKRSWFLHRDVTNHSLELYNNLSNLLFFGKLICLEFMNHVWPTLKQGSHTNPNNAPLEWPYIFSVWSLKKIGNLMTPVENARRDVLFKPKSKLQAPGSRKVLLNGGLTRNILVRSKRCEKHATNHRQLHLDLPNIETISPWN